MDAIARHSQILYHPPRLYVRVDRDEVGGAEDEALERRDRSPRVQVPRALRGDEDGPTPGGDEPQGEQGPEGGGKHEGVDEVRPLRSEPSRQPKGEGRVQLRGLAHAEHPDTVLLQAGPEEVEGVVDEDRRAHLRVTNEAHRQLDQLSLRPTAPQVVDGVEHVQLPELRLPGI